MIRLRCSTCQKALGVKPELAGRTVICPACKSRLKVPAGEAIQPEIVEPEIVEDFEVVTPAPVAATRTRPVAAARERDEDDFDEEKYEPRPRRRKRRRRQSSVASGRVAGIDLVPIVLVVVAVLGIAGIGVGLVSTPVSNTVVILWFGIILFGGIWLVVQAFIEDISQGLLCLFVPFYLVYYAISRFDEVRLPASLYGIGLFIFLTDCCMHSRTLITGFSDGFNS